MKKDKKSSIGLEEDLGNNTILSSHVLGLKSLKEVLLKKKYHPELHHFKEAHLGIFISFYHVSVIFLGPINAVAISHDNKYIISGSSDKCIKIYDLAERQEIYSFNDVHEGNLTLFLGLV